MAARIWAKSIVEQIWRQWTQMGLAFSFAQRKPSWLRYAHASSGFPIPMITVTVAIL
jgi:hypothetical protein